MEHRVQTDVGGLRGKAVAVIPALALIAAILSPPMVAGNVLTARTTVEQGTAYLMATCTTGIPVKCVYQPQPTGENEMESKQKRFDQGSLNAAPAPTDSGAFSPAQMAQIQEMMKQAFSAGAASVPRLPDDEFKAQQRLRDQAEAAKREHPVEIGSLRHGQTLRDGT